MNHPAFFDEIPPVRLHDPLAELLGASEDGLLEYRYLDAVRLAGHSCPTVAGAWNMTRLALNALYRDELPVRGNIAVELRGSESEGVTGVVAAVVSLLTGAAAGGGFKGLGGQYARRKLLRFAADIPFDLRFSRRDTGDAVDVAYFAQALPGMPDLPDLLGACLDGRADPETRRLFGRRWQERVRHLLLERADDPLIFLVRPCHRSAPGTGLPPHTADVA